MTTLTHLNWLAVVVASFAYFMLGWLWFTLLFRKTWAQGHGMSIATTDAEKEKMKKEMPKTILSAFVFCFILTIALACLEAATGTHEWMKGCKMGILAGVFAVIPIAQSHFHTKKPFSLMLIDGGYHLVGLSIAGIILSLF